MMAYLTMLYVFNAGHGAADHFYSKGWHHDNAEI